MKNKILNNSENATSIADALEDNQFVHWILNNGKNLLLAFFVIAALFLVIYRLIFGSMVKSEIDFITAENDYQRLLKEKNGTAQQETLQRLKNNFKSHPELNAKYDGLLAQYLIATNQPAEALTFATKSIKRTTTENSPFYNTYSETTLLVIENKYEEALNQSLNLKEQLLQNETTEQTLFALNLLRIGILQQQLSLVKEELATWKEWDNQLASKENSDFFQKITDNFIVGKVSLTNYIESRKKSLSNI